MNGAALRSACGTWLNTYSTMFGFDSYDTSKEIWHQEYRSPKTGAGSPEAIELLNCCGSAVEVAFDAIQYSDQAIREALKRIPRPRLSGLRDR